MAFNRAVLDYLEKLEFNRADQRNRRAQLKALSALADVDPFNLANFRPAVVVNIKKLFPELVGSPQIVDNDTFLTQDGEPNDPIPINLLQQKAKEKRILFGLEMISQGQLKEIFDSATDAATRTIIKAEELGRKFFGNKLTDDDLSSGLLTVIRDRAKELHAQHEAKETAQQEFQRGCAEFNEVLENNKFDTAEADDTLSKNKTSHVNINQSFLKLGKAYDAAKTAYASGNTVEDKAAINQIIIDERKANIKQIKFSCKYQDQLVDTNVTEITTFIENNIAGAAAAGVTDLQKKAHLRKARDLLKTVDPLLEEMDQLASKLINLRSLDEQSSGAKDIRRLVTDHTEAVNELKEKVILQELTLGVQPELIDTHQARYIRSSDFTEEVVQTSQQLKPIDVVQDNHVNVQAQGGRYTVKTLLPGEALHLRVKWPVMNAQGQPTRQEMTGHLIQERSGKVTNVSGDLSDEKRMEVAFKQAELILNDYKPGNGNIIIRGSATYVKDAQFLLVALIQLQEKGYPHLQDVKIESRVAGCKVPDGKGLNRVRGRLAECINDNAIPAGVKPLINQFADEVIAERGKLDGLKKTHTDRVKALYAEFRNAVTTAERKAEIAQAIRLENIEKDDTINTQGVVIKPHR